MTMQTSTFHSPALENASVMLDMCRTEYERAGHAGPAQALRGLDITSQAAAHLALATVYALPTISGLSELRDCTLDAVRRAFSSYDDYRKAS